MRPDESLSGRCTGATAVWHCQLRELREKAELWLYGDDVRNVPEFPRMLSVLADLASICETESLGNISADYTAQRSVGGGTQAVVPPHPFGVAGVR